LNIGKALKKAITILKEAQNTSPAVDAGVILCFLLGLSKTYILTHYDFLLGQEEIKKYFKLIDLRARGTPVQYITGKKEFMSLEFTVNPCVLIPRPETEILVEWIIDYVKNQECENHTKRENYSILDIGTGSGCIAISLAHYINCNVTSVDISQEALDIACINANLNKVTDRITFIKSNLFEALKNVTFDIIVSNPPYIPSNEIENLEVEVKGHEPTVALDGGEDGLDYFKVIVENTPVFLKEDGVLAFEVGYNQASKVKNIMEKYFKKIDTIKDLGMVDRVVIGQFS
jgi:release factor glutamine methyltransferase